MVRAMTFRILLLALALLFGGATLEGRPAGAGSIGDIISDFLYYQEELKVKAPAKPLAEVVAGVGERYLGLLDVAGGLRLWDFETGGQVLVQGQRPAQARAFFPNH